MDYYKNTHLPETAAAWKKYGWQSYVLCEAINLPGIPLVSYGVMCVATWEARREDGLEGIRTALQSEEGKRLQKDVDNYTNRKPVGFVGNVLTNTFSNIARR